MKKYLREHFFVLLVALVCMVVSQGFFGMLQWSSFEKRYRDVLVSPRMFINSAAWADIQVNIYSGKTVTRFQGFDRVARRVLGEDASVAGIGLMRPDGQLEQWVGKVDVREIVLPEKFKKEAVKGKPAVGQASAAGQASATEQAKKIGAPPEMAQSARISQNGLLFLVTPLYNPDIYVTLGLLDPSDKLAGYFAMALDESVLYTELGSTFDKILFLLGTGTLAAFIMFALASAFIKYRDKYGNIARMRLIMLIVLPLLLVQGLGAAFLLKTVNTVSTQAVISAAEDNLYHLRDKIIQVRDMGINLYEVRGIDNAMREILRFSPVVSSMTLSNRQGNSLLHVEKEHVEKSPALGPESVLLTFAGQYGGKLIISSTLDWSGMAKSLRSNALDVLSTFIISILLLIEIVFLLAVLLDNQVPSTPARPLEVDEAGRVLEGALAGTAGRAKSETGPEAGPEARPETGPEAGPEVWPEAAPGSLAAPPVTGAATEVEGLSEETRRNRHAARQRGLMRGLAFFFLMAMDMSLSFIPLRMEDILQQAPGMAGKDLDVLLGLPVSFEMGGASLSILLAGFWIMRKNSVQPMLVGLLLTAAGYLASSLAVNMAGFVAARALCGLGYGFALMALQNVVIDFSGGREQGSHLASLFAGVYAGSLCGSAAGAMLADRFGYSSVFLASSAMLGVLVVFCLAWARRNWNASRTVANAPCEPCIEGEPCAPCAEDAGGAGGPGGSQKLSWQGMQDFFTDRKVLSALMFSLFPGALITVGMVNFFLPVFLNRSGVSQSDIGRVFTLYCLIFICFSPVLGRWVEGLRRKAVAVALSGLLGAVCLLSFALPSSVISPFTASLCAAVFMGLFLAVGLPAQNSFILNTKAAKTLGSEQAMSIYNSVERLGQVLGPLLFGAGLLMFPAATFSLISGVAFLVITLVFLVLTGKED